MKKSQLQFLMVIMILSTELFAQVSFLGFDKEKCYILENSGYGYQNIIAGCGSHSGSYVIYYNGDLIYESPCQNFEWWSITNFFFINDSTGYYMEHYSNTNSQYIDKILIVLCTCL